MIKLCLNIKELLKLKRMNDILDQVCIEKKKKEDEAMKILKEGRKEALPGELPKLYQPRLIHGYESDLRPFVRKLMEFKTDQEIVASVMKILDQDIDSGIDMYKMSKREEAA